MAYRKCQRSCLGYIYSGLFSLTSFSIDMATLSLFDDATSSTCLYFCGISSYSPHRLKDESKSRATKAAIGAICCNATIAVSVVVSTARDKRCGSSTAAKVRQAASAYEARHLYVNSGYPLLAAPRLLRFLPSLLRTTSFLSTPPTPQHPLPTLIPLRPLDPLADPPLPQIPRTWVRQLPLNIPTTILTQPEVTNHTGIRSYRETRPGNQITRLAPFSRVREVFDHLVGELLAFRGERAVEPGAGDGFGGFGL